jgi:hypothetical protein
MRILVGTEKVEQLLADQVAEGLLEPEGLADLPRGLALLNPNLVELAHRRPV